MKDVITISVVNFASAWGNREKNLRRIAEQVEAAGKKGVDMIVFPECALLGYDDDAGKPVEEKMHVKLAETIPGPSSKTIAKITQKYGMFAIFGMAERDAKDSSKLYNSAAICRPDGTIEGYRKIHLPPFNEFWGTRSDKLGLFDTPWGPVGIGICCDSYCFPEIMRCCRGMGARLFINCTAICTEESGGAGGYLGNLSLQYLSMNNNIFIATSNLCGQEVSSYYMGGSSIIGPAGKGVHVNYYAGKEFLAPGADELTVETATVDLSSVKRPFMNAIFDPIGEVPFFDWRPEVYKAWYEKASQNGVYARPEKPQK